LRRESSSAASCASAKDLRLDNLGGRRSSIATSNSFAGVRVWEGAAQIALLERIESSAGDAQQAGQVQQQKGLLKLDSNRYRDIVLRL